MSNKHGAHFAFVLCLITVTYGVFQARTLIHGPTLVVSSPQPGETISSVLMAIHGKTENVTHVRVNGQLVTMDTSGAFDETFVTPEGYGVLLVEATNRFGRREEQRIEFTGAPADIEPTPAPADTPDEDPESAEDLAGTESEAGTTLL